MYEFTGTAEDLKINLKNGQACLTVEINERNDVISAFEEFSKFPKLKIKLEKFRPKRSLSANAYAWQLMSQIAEEQGITKEEVYRHHIKEVGVFQVVEINSKAVETLLYSWGLHGLGWFGEKLDVEQNRDFVVVALYYGSSSYNTKQMSRLIENIIQDCNVLGIQTKTQDEISNMLNLWETEKRKERL